MDSHSSTARIDKPYSTGRVIAIYTLLGGGIGGLVVFLWIAVLTLIDTHSLPLRLIALAPITAIYGTVIGAVPALITALIVSKLRLHFYTLKDAVSLFAIGWLATLVYIVCLFMVRVVMATAPMPELILVFALYSPIGGVSAVITGWIALPKDNRQAQ